MNTITPDTPRYIAYFNNEDLRSRIIDLLEDAHSAGKLVQNNGYDPKTGRGCPEGQILKLFDSHTFAIDVEQKTNIPADVLKLMDGIYELLPPDQAPAFGVEIHRVIKAGAVLDDTVTKFMVRLLTELMSTAYDQDLLEPHKTLQEVKNLYKQILQRGVEPMSEFRHLTKDIYKKFLISQQSQKPDAWLLHHAYTAASLATGETLNALPLLAEAIHDKTIAAETAATMLIDVLNTSELAEIEGPLPH